MSRRTFNPGSIHVYVWYAATSGLTKCIWQSAISQHQFYLDRKQARLRGQAQHRTLKEIARDLTRSSASLSSASSASNVSLSGSSHSVAVSGSIAGHEHETELTEEARRARMEMVAALKARREALEEKLKEKKSLLKEVCLKEGELTGELPPEIPLAPGEPLPVIRRRVGTEFQISESLMDKTGGSERDGEQLAQLELELEIQSKITSAQLKLANDTSARKNVRRQRKISYNQCQKKLKELEFKVASMKHAANAGKKKPVKVVNRTGKEEMRRGISVPDLDSAPHMEHPSLDVSLSNATVSPRSCPSSPRKQPLGLPQPPQPRPTQHQHPKTVTQPRQDSGYIPSSVYLRSSYRAKQYPTLSTGNKTHNHRHSQFEPHSSAHASTLPSPYKNKFELNAGCDSPVGLYNCPQQRTSQAFSSLDDLDGLAAMSAPPTRREPGHTHYPSLERSARKKTRAGPLPSAHTLTGQSVASLGRTDGRSLEQVAGARQTGRAGLAPDIAAREQALDDLVYRTHQTTLRNTDEYPRVIPRPGFADEVDGGSYPLPLPARRTTLLPGQTYPEPSLPAAQVLGGDSPLLPVFPQHRHPASLPRHGQTMTVHARKVETTFGLNDSVHTAPIPETTRGSPKPSWSQEGDEPKPPLFPKQYYLKQRSLTEPTSDSPAVPRKLKPSLGGPAHHSPAGPASLATSSSLSAASENNNSFDTPPASEAHHSPHIGAFVPYRETSKPFEMSDFYKYSTKFRKTSASSLTADSDSPQLPGSQSPRSGSASQRSSTSRESCLSVPPELPAKPAVLSPPGTVTAIPALARLKPGSRQGSKESLADAFSTEMLAWYEQKQTIKPPTSQANGGPASNKPATLV